MQACMQAVRLTDSRTPPAVHCGNRPANVVMLFSGVNFRRAATSAPDEVEQLVRRLRERDSAAFDQLYDQYHQLVYGIARRMLPDAQAAEDVTQATFLKLWTSPEAFRGGHFSGWLGRVARNCAIDALRRRAVRREATTPAARAALEARTEDLALAKNDGDHVRRALERLPRENRELIEMGFFAGISHSEIARITALPAGTVKTRIRTGLRRLRAELEQLIRA
jgi:RNA polymerase sigma-70 factor (ECF subfamily)